MRVSVVTAPSGSGSSKGAGSEARNTLRSKSVARVLDLLGEGELALVDGEKSIFFDGVPLKSDDDTRNFQGVSWAFNRGLADQSALPGFSAVETEVVYATEVKKHVPVTRSITNQDATAARVTIRIPALAFQPAKGGLKGSSVSFRIEVRADGGAWSSPFGDIVITGKCTAPYDRSYRIVLPRNAGDDPSYPWDIRVTRITNDSDDVDDDGIPDDTEASIKTRTENRTVFQSVTEIVERRLSYPWSAHIGLVFDAKKFGSALPTRSYEVKRIDGLVPVNYDPATRIYTGVWNGEFKAAENSNPAWAVYDMLRSKRFGLGRELSAEALDMVKWDLYEIGRYCDETIPDGFGGTEPRFTFNGVIKSQKEAYDLIAMLMSVCRGMTYWSSGAIRAVADQPTDPIVLVTPANVVDGDFRYSGTALKSRHTVVHVTWNDPDDRYRAAVEVVEDGDGIRRFGRRVKEVVAVGCTSRGQARRFGLWVLATELGEDQIVTYRAGFDHAYVSTGHPGVVPGDVVAIQDPRIAGVDWSGRLLAGSTASVVKLDRSVTLPSGTNTLSVVLPSGATASRTVSTTGSASTLTLASALPETPAAGAVWILQSASIAPRPFRVTSVAEVEKNVFEIKALLNDTTKYARVDYGVKLKKRTYTKLTTKLGKPVNLSSREYQFLEDGAAHSKLTFSWSAPSVGTAVAYHVVVEAPAGEIDFGVVTATSIDITDAVAGDYVLNVASVGYSGKESDFATLPVTATGWTGSTAPTVTDLKLVGGDTSTTFSGRDVTIAWTNTLSSGGSAGNPFYLDDVIEVRDGSDGTLLRTQSVRGETWTYAYDLNAADCVAKGKAGPARQLAFSVVCRDTLGRESDPATLTVSNPVPAAVTPTLIGTNEAIHIGWSNPVDPDYAGMLVWVGTTSTFTPGSGNLVYDGPDSSISVQRATGTYYVVIAPYDAFGKVGLNLSSPTAVLVEPIVDPTPPAVPTGLALTPSLARASDGTITTKLAATVDASPSGNFGHFEFEIKVAAGEWIAFPSSTARYEWGGLVVAATYSVRVRALSKYGYPSAWCAAVDATIPSNTTAPGAPTGLSASASFQNAYLAWTNPSDSDLDHVEIWENTTNTQPNPSTQASLKIGEVKGTRFTRPLATGVTRWYWVRAVNSSGLAGAFNAVSGVSATTGGIGSGDLLDAAVTTAKFASGIEPITIVATGSLPTTKSTEVINYGGKLYRWSGTAYVATIASTDISGTIADAQIAGLAAAKVTGQLTDIQLAAIAAAKITGTIATVQIADAALTVAKFASGIEPVSIVASLPNATGYTGPKVVFNQTDGKLYRYTAGAWTATTNAGDITGQLTDAQISAIAAAKLAGSITSTQITDGAVSTAKLAAGAVTAAKIAADTITANELAAGAVTASEIAAGAVTTAKLAAAAVTANELAANAVVAGKIAAGAVSASEIAAGAITTDKLAVGTGGNWIENSDLQAGLTGFGYEYSTDVTKFQLDYVSEHWAPLGGAIRVFQYDGVVGHEYGVAVRAPGSTGNRWFPIVAGSWYELSVYYTGHRCAGIQPYIGFFSASDTLVSYVSGGVFPANQNIDANFDLAAYSRAWFKTQAPTGAVKAYVFFRMKGVVAGQTNPYLWFTRPYFGPANQNQTGPSDWAPAGLTLIASGNVTTGAITAEKIAAGAVTTAKLAADAVTANEIAAGAVTATELAAGAVVAGKIAAGAIQAADIAAGTITGDRLAASTITATQIAADTITAAQIAAGAISASELAAGAVTTEKLAVGGNGNMLYGSDGTVDPSRFLTQGWNPDGITGYTIARAGAGADWTLPDYSTMSIRQGNDQTGSVGVTDFCFQRPNSDGSFNAAQGYHHPIEAGKTYEFSVYMGAHRCNAWANILFIDVSENIVGGVSSYISSGEAVGGNALSGYKRLFAKGVAPSNATKAAVYIRKGHTLAGNGDSWLFFTRPQFKETVPNATEPSAWSPPGVTLIDGSSIISNAITAAKVAAGAITADKITSAAVTADKLAANSVTADKIAALAVDASKVVVTGSTTLASWRNGSDATKIEGGAIAANSITANKLKIGARGIYMSGIDFQADASSSTLTWSGGAIIWTDDAGSSQVSSVSNGSVAWGGWVAVYWVKGEGSLRYANDTNGGWGAPNSNADAVVLAVYEGGALLQVLSGGTIVDGSRITTGSIQAAQIAAGAIVTDKLGANVVTAAKIASAAITTDKLAADAVTAAKIAAETITATELAAGAVTAAKMSVSTLSSITANLGTVTAGIVRSTDGKFLLDLANKRILISD